jgi:beta-1,2-mannobiose phosphorylase / 1,2-beta-oligomannan phosphorylase
VRNPSTVIDTSSSFAYVGPTALTVRRISDEPIVAAGTVPGYGPIFNAGLIHHDGSFHLFARGVRDSYRRNDRPGPLFLDYISDVLVFTSADGFRFAFQQVLARGSPDDVDSYEDPRVQRVRSGGDEQIVMSYTNLPSPDSGLPWRVGLHRLFYDDGRFRLDSTSGRVVSPAGTKDKDAVIFNLRDGRVGLIHRMHPNIQLAIFESLDELCDPPERYWETHMRELAAHTLIRPAAGALGVGAGAPPIATTAGLLLFFHEREADDRYTTKVALLDDETGRVRSLLPDPIMRPELPWECFGDIDNIIFVQGAVLLPDGTIYLTYGAADRCVGAASVASSALLEALAVD